MNHQVSAEVHRFLENRRSKTIIYNQYKVMFPAKASSPLKIDDFEPGITWCLQVKYFRLRPDCSFPAFRFISIDIIRSYAPFGKNSRKQLVRTPKYCTARQDMVTAF